MKTKKDSDKKIADKTKKKATKKKLAFKRSSPENRCLLACRELSFGRTALSARQSLTPETIENFAYKVDAARTLGYYPGTEFYLRAS